MVRSSIMGVFAAASSMGASSAGAAVIYGGPTNNTVAGTGYSAQLLRVAPGTTAGNGVGVCDAFKSVSGTNVGNFALRWTNSGAPATELGNLGTTAGGRGDASVYAVNSAGATVGVSNKYNNGTALGTRAVRWDAGATAATELGILGADANGVSDATAYAINPTGLIVGSATRYIAGSARGSRAVRWAAGSPDATELGNIGTDVGGVTNNVAYAVNAGGTVVGLGNKYSGDTLLGTRAIRWNAGGTAATELNNLGTTGAGVTTALAYSVNDTGTAVGLATKYNAGSDLGIRAVRWAAGATAATELGTLDTTSTGSSTSVAYRINAAGTAVGYAIKFVNGMDLGARAVRWAAGGTAATELGNLGTDAGGSTSSTAWAINADGIAVGFSQKYTGGTSNGFRAVAWGTDGVAIDLNTLLAPADAGVWTLTEARGISDTNWVTGNGDYDPDGAGPLPSYGRTFLLQVPEPGSLAVFAVAGLFARRRRR